MEKISYLTGFNNEFASEAAGFEGALPPDSINPQRCKFNLVAEQLSGSAFTAPRHLNKRSWLYRTVPSARHEPYTELPAQRQLDYASGQPDPNQKRWRPFAPDEQHAAHRTRLFDFAEGLDLLAFSEGAPDGGCGAASVSIFVYFANKSMSHNSASFVNADGDFLIVPQEGALLLRTEFGLLRVEPNEIAVVQQGMKFQVDLPDKVSYEDPTLVRGYILEVTGGQHFELAQLGPIGANGLANPRYFEVPTAAVAQAYNSYNRIFMKTQGRMYTCTQSHTPYDVAAWFGNYVPYKFNLAKFAPLNAVQVDHPDPSVFTVLTCPSAGRPGTALADFVIFPPRWECARDTFRPPYYHRNCMTEFMGLIKGKYQAKSRAFAPGGATLHQAMMPHGPDTECFEAASSQDTSAPARVADDTMAFMFETSLPLKLTRWARESNVDADYYKCWFP